MHLFSLTGYYRGSRQNSGGSRLGVAPPSDFPIPRLAIAPRSGTIRRDTSRRHAPSSLGRQPGRLDGAADASGRAGSTGSKVFRWTRASASACWSSTAGSRSSAVAMTVAIAIGATAFEVINDSSIRRYVHALMSFTIAQRTRESLSVRRSARSRVNCCWASSVACGLSIALSDLDVRAFSGGDRIGAGRGALLTWRRSSRSWPRSPRWGRRGEASACRPSTRCASTASSQTNYSREAAAWLQLAVTDHDRPSRALLAAGSEKRADPLKHPISLQIPLDRPVAPLL